MTRLSFEVTVPGLDHIPHAEVAPDQIWPERDLACPGLSADEACRSGLALASRPHAGGFFLWKYDKEEGCYFDPGLRISLVDVARVVANRSPTPCRIH